MLRILYILGRLGKAGGSAGKAADLRLLEEADTIDLTRYDRVAVASGDHRFADLVHTCRGLGLETLVAGYRSNIAHRLVAAADTVIDLAGPTALAA